jgi:hypothetical protein
MWFLTLARTLPSLTKPTVERAGDPCAARSERRPIQDPSDAGDEVTVVHRSHAIVLVPVDIGEEGPLAEVVAVRVDAVGYSLS